MSPIQRIVTCSLLFIALTGYSQTVIYTSDESVIANPERGFYHHTEVHTGQYENLNAETLKGYRTNEGITQILRVFYLENFRESPISGDYLNNMRRDFAIARSAGIKVIVRFAYSQGTTAPYNDARPEFVQTHIDQLKPVLRENADVIAVMQAGFIGTWGEWYYTDHFANSPGQISAEDWENRRQVVYSLLDALPEDRMVQLRTPGYKFTILDSQEPLNETTAFSGSYASRVGHHNDCFVASSSDFGTYVNPAIEKPYLREETRFTPMGGETCALASPYSDCENSLSDLEQFHWSYLNIDYNRQVLSEWDNQGCFDEVELRLGYRFKMIAGTFTTATKPNGKFVFSLTLQNDGFSNPYNPRLIEVILKNTTTDAEYLIQPDENIKLWPLNEAFNLTFEAGIPADMADGDYQLYLNLPDPYPSLYKNPAYAIRLADESTWDSETGYNNLLSTVSISASNSSEDYTGLDYFTPRLTQSTIEVEGADQIFGAASNNAILTYWGRQGNDLMRVIERSTGTESFETIASISAAQDYFLDLNVAPGTNYTYRYYLSSATGSTSPSAEITLTLSEESYPTIVIDGESSDWNTITPVSSTVSDAEAKVLRVFFGAQSAFVLLEGEANDYSIYLDADNDLSTGFQDNTGPLSGMDYQLTENGLSEYSSNQWTTTNASINKANGDKTTELSIPLDALENLGDNRNLRIYATLNNGTALLSNSEGQPTNLYRALPPAIPGDFSVRNSTELPETRLVVSWSACANCLGYTLERSQDGETFDLIGTYDTSVSLIRDDNLTNMVTYYYRIASYNELGTSGYSETVHATTGVIQLSTQPELPVLFPNPTQDRLFISTLYDQFAIYSLDGALITKGDYQKSIDVRMLRAGMYVLHIQTAEGSKQLKFVRK